eukprot:GEMP01006432.1.p1 GENE.GEMP01006432.1~~GEMP01006432.1.p1  ORF type:complete len:835 (+),score=146.80 GEMP01006432.1:81-2585(+)
MSGGPSLLQRLPCALAYTVHDRLKSAFYIILARRPELSQLLPVFSAWRQYWRRERRQATQTDIFKVFRIRERIRRCFQTWRAYWALRKELRNAHLCLRLLRRYALVLQVWKLWVIVTRHECTSRTLRLGAFHAWSERIVDRRQKMRLNETLRLQRRRALSRRMSLWMQLARCVAWNRSRVAFCCLQGWQRHAAHRQRLRTKALTFQRSPLRHRRSFGRWVSALNGERRRQVHLVGMLDDCFNTWKQGVMVEAKRKLLAFQIRHRLVYSVFNEWVRQRRIIQRLIFTYASRMLQGSAHDILAHWLDYVRQQKIARKVRVRCLARKALRSWLEVFVMLEKQMFSADAWHARRVLSSCFCNFRAKSHDKAVGRHDATHVLRQIAMKMDVATIAAAVTTWVLFVQSEQHSAACSSYIRAAQAHSSTAAYFNLWRTHSSMLADLRQLSTRVITNIHDAGNSFCFSVWRRYVESKRCRRASGLTIKTRATMRLERVHLGLWRIHALMLARVRQLCIRVGMSAYWNRLKWAFKGWASDVRMEKTRQEREVWATHRYRVIFFRQCFVPWARYASIIIRAKNTSDAMSHQYELFNAMQQLRIWRENVCRRHNSTRLLTNVFLHLVQRLTATAMRSWVTALSLKRMRVHCESTIRARNEARIKRVSVKAWRDHASARVDRRTRFSLVVVEVDEAQRAMVFSSWHRTVQKLRAQRDTASHVRHFGRRRRLAAYWVKWASEFARVRRFQAFSHYICTLHRTALLSGVLRSWRRHLFCTNATRVMAQKLSRSKRTACLEEWHHIAKELCRMRRISSVICQRRHTKHYFLNVWKARCCGGLLYARGIP